MDFIAKKNTIAPATSNAAPANKLTSELELPYHMNNATPKNATEISISRRWALRIRTRIELDCITFDLPRADVYRGMAYKKIEFCSCSGLQPRNQSRLSGGRGDRLG
jgi:hypothetical protein